MMIGSAALANVRRIERYLLQQAKLKRQAMEATQSTKSNANSPAAPFLSALWACCQQWLSPYQSGRAAFVFGF
jgi:hypothetical protein